LAKTSEINTNRSLLSFIHEQAFSFISWAFHANIIPRIPSEEIRHPSITII
jgi:hypothetical protein